jgi:alpha-glucosidase
VEYRHVYLPAGAWAQWWTGEIIEGPAHVLAHAPLGRPALYARVNTPIPMWPVLQDTDEVPDALTWRVFVGRGSGSGSLYEHSGDGDGPWCRRTAHVERGERFVLSEREGSFVPGRRVFVEVVGGARFEVEETAEAVVIERLVTTDP